jgi:hypothetical protein
MMTALIIIGCILLFFVFLLSLKATITIAYTDEVTLTVRVLFLKIKILPKKEKKGPRSMSRRKAERIRAKARKKAQKKRDAAKAKARDIKSCFAECSVFHGRSPLCIVIGEIHIPQTIVPHFCRNVHSVYSERRNMLTKVIA